MKPIPYVLLLLFVVLVAGMSSRKKTRGKNQATNAHTPPVVRAGTPPYLTLLRQKADAARTFTRQKGFNERFCFFADMHLPSGQNRFFVYDLAGDSVLRAGPVAHGNCYEYWLEGRRYSNTSGSGCTSLGKYRVGYPYMGKFGYSYKLYGLDSSNNNAFDRTVVLHGHDCVPDSATGEDICQSNGCPMVSPGLLLALKTIINGSKKPVLLWVYDEGER